MNNRDEVSYSLSGSPSAENHIAMMADLVQFRPIVLVGGMPRSGMSLCAHILSAMGIYMTDEISVHGSDTRNQWERREIVEFHDRILRLFNRAYLGPFHDFSLPVAWWADPRVSQIRSEIVAFLNKRMDDSYFGFKDPRTARLMPIWHYILNDLKLTPKVVICLRSPSEVARSLKAHDGVDLRVAEYRSLIYMIDSARYTKDLDVCTIDYEGWFNDPLANFEKLRKFLNLRWQQSKFDLDVTLSGIIDPAMNHGHSDHRKANQSLVYQLYELASHTGLDRSAREQIGDVVSQLINFEQMQRPLQEAFEDIAAIAAKFPELEQEAAALQAAVNERDSVVDAANERAARAEERLAEALIEIDQQRTEIAGLTGERDEREITLANLSRRIDELVTTLEATRAKLALHETALEQAERMAQERTAAAEVMQAEVQTLRKILAPAEQQRTTPAMQAEIAALWDSLGQLREEARQREAAMLAEAEDETKKHAATTAALQAEIATLKGTLAATRQVGKAAIAAFRIETTVSAKPAEARGWRRAVIRLLRAEPSLLIDA